MKKVLYFEGAGMPETDRSGEIGNCRIRTAFTLKNGKKVYFEAMAWKPSDEMIKAYNNAESLQRGKNGERYLSQKLKPGKIYISVDSLHYITDKTDENGINISDCNESRIIFNNDLSREWTKSDLLAFVNSLGADFDEVECLPDLAGYRVFADGIKQPQRNGNIKNYNYGDKFDYNAEQTARRIKTYQEIYKQEQERTGKKYPCFSFYVDSTNKDRCIFHRFSKEADIYYYIPEKEEI